MPRRPVPFRQADVTRALRGAQSAGVDVARVEIDRHGKIVIVPARPGDQHEASETEQALDRELEEFEARHGEGGLEGRR